MTKENVGIFIADHEYSSFLMGYALELTEAKNFDFVISALSELLQARKLLSSGSYLHTADAEAIRRDSADEGEGLYSVSSETLASMSDLPPLQEALDPDYRKLVSEFLAAFGTSYGNDFTEDFEAELQVAVANALADKDKKEAANRTLAAGTAVYLSRPDSRPAKLTTTPFNPLYHDARKVLEASKVAQELQGELELYPLPPSTAKADAKFWGHFKHIPAKKAYFTGHTQQDVRLKAAVHEAWGKMVRNK